MSRTRTHWLGNETLRKAILAAITRSDKDNFSFLNKIAHDQEVPKDCDPVFISLVKFLVDKDLFTENDIKQTEKVWKFFQDLCRQVCSEVTLPKLSRTALRERYLRIGRITECASLLSEFWAHPDEQNLTVSKPTDPRSLRQAKAREIFGYEAVHICLQDPTIALFLQNGTPPETVPQGNSDAHQIIFSALCMLIQNKILNIECEPAKFILELAKWLGNADDWPNWNMHAAISWVADRYGLGHCFENATDEIRQEVARAWPEVARTMGENAFPPVSEWPQRTKKCWVEGVLTHARRQLPQDTDSIWELFQSSTCPILKSACWTFTCARTVKVKIDGNPFDTRMVHPFKAKDMEVQEPAKPSFEECSIYQRSRSAGKTQ